MTVRSIRHVVAVLLLPLAGAAAVPRGPAGAASPGPVRGDYVEVRTASVFAGACHYNGERVTEGRSAVLALKIDTGAADGVDLAGVRLMAAVTADQNLAEPAAKRRTSIVVDAGSDAQAAAATAWVKSRCGEQLGSIVNVRRGAVTFGRASDTFKASSAVGALSVVPMPDRACCSQPQLVWYQPLMPITDRRVGYTLTSAATATNAGGAWQRSDENSAMYGTLGR